MSKLCLLTLIWSLCFGCTPQIFGKRSPSGTNSTSESASESAPAGPPTPNAPSMTRYEYSDILDTGCPELNKGVIGPCGDLSGMDLSGEDLSGLDLRGSIFNGANLSNTRFLRTNFSGADLRNANLAGANFTDSWMSSAIITGANLTDAVLINVNWGATIDGGGTTYPAGFHPENFEIVPPDSFNCNSEPKETFPLIPSCASTGSNCANMVIVRATCNHTLAGQSPNDTWRNLNRVCGHYGFQAPTYLSTVNASGTLWDGSVNQKYSFTSRNSQGSYDWLMGSLPTGFPGGRIWVQTDSKISKATYPSIPGGDMLLNPGIQWESADPWLGGNGETLLRGNIQPGEYLMCSPGNISQRFTIASDTAVSVEANSSVVFDLNYVSKGNGPLTITVDTSDQSVTSGSAIVLPDGRVQYTPKANYVGSDVFPFLVMGADGIGANGQVWVTVTMPTITSDCNDTLPIERYTFSPSCAGCADMVLVKATCKHSLGGENADNVWTNLEGVCSHYGHHAPKTSSSLEPSQWTSAPGAPYNSDTWNPTGPWMTGSFLDPFPGGKIWIQSGYSDWLSVAVYPNVSVGDSLYTQTEVIQWLSYHPQYGGNWKNISMGSVGIGDYLMCSK